MSLRCFIAARRWRLLLPLVSLVLPAGASGALRAQQRPVRDSLAVPADSAARDSLAARLERAEAAIALLRRQLAVEAGTAVRTRSRLQVELSARIMTNTFLSTQRVNNPDLPQFALPDLAVPPTLPGAPLPQPSAGTRDFGLSVRQSRVGAAVTVDSVLGGTFEGDIELDFFGGVSNGPGDRRLFPEPRMRTARARLRWDRTTLFVGSETPLISDLNPISVAAASVPGFVAAGNLWNWLPQVRLSRDLYVHRSGLRLGVQGAALAPVTGVQHLAEPDAVDAGERSARPFLQGRVHLRWGAGGEFTGAPSDVLMGEPGGEVGVGIHRGWVRVSGDTNTASRAVSADVRYAPTRWLELRGEAYRGQLVRGLGGGAIGQSFGRAPPGEPLGPPLHDSAGWLQLNLQPHPTLISGAGCGRDVVRASQVPVRLANSACAAHLLWRPAQPIIVGLEFRRITTRYDGDTNRANHLNLAFGFEL
ncbi:MAG: hypothetical protein IT355_18150 [Gemmatimonadaceae bacterium]|nr:hypothetical protein [Gemmatimonadaceae bacterium]